MVGTQRLVLRGCDNNNNLLEVNFYVNVSSNSAPEFNTDIQTQWALNVNDKVPYKLPSWTDPEGNDVGQVYINSMENQDFPAFIHWDNTTYTITMEPNSTKYQGKTYYFSVVLKEINSDFMMNIYYMTVKINGDPVDESAQTINATQVSINVPSLDYHSNGVLTFTVDVQMDLLLADWT